MKITHRPRRLRRTESLRNSLAETRCSLSQLVYPLFIQEENKDEEIRSMPGVTRWSEKQLFKVLENCLEKGIYSVAFFPKIPENQKDSTAKESLNPEGFIPRVIRESKKRFPELILYSDVALDPYSSDGHDGIVKNGEIVNDETVKLLTKMALLHAEAGVDFVAPSDMMDGRIGAIRSTLDENGFTQTGILSYAAKYASSFYGPFRDALDSAPRNGDKKTYQMDIRNVREAIREVELDLQEGADLVMVKPAGAYLDVIHQVKEISSVPVAAYQVSGEYSMIQIAAKHGLFSLEKAMEESILSIRRAGADLIFTYFALDLAKLWRE
ncbi:MAG: porphobilinogen synthase [Oligoflexia bacterium]|nr:porphobilinogen synthase [Oligoflexia bacterium]